MSEGLNRVMLLGALGADPEPRFTQGGSCVLSMRLATTERYKDKEEWKERTEWHSVAMFGKRAEALAKILKKGDSIFVEGSLRTTSYDKDGSKRYRTEVIANNVILNGGRGRGVSDAAYGSGVRAPTNTPHSDYSPNYIEDEPF